MRILSWLISLPIFGAIIIFVLQNRYQVPVSFWPFDAEITLPVSILSLGILIVGFIAGSLVTAFGLIKTQIEVKQLRKKVASLTKQVEEKTPLSSQPSILYNGRYQPVPEIERPPALKRRWFGRTP